MAVLRSRAVQQNAQMVPPSHEVPQWHSRSENFIFKKEFLGFFPSGKQTNHESVCGPHSASAQEQAEVPVQVLLVWRKSEEVCTLALLSPLKGLPLHQELGSTEILADGMCKCGGMERPVSWNDIPAVCWFGDCGKPIPD